MANVPAYAATPRMAPVAISTANTNRDGTGTIGTVFTAGSSGSRIDAVQIVATGTTTAGMVRLYKNNGTTSYLFKEVPVLAITPSATVPGFAAFMNANTNPELFPMVLPVSCSLRASTHNAETFNVIADGGDI